MTKKRYVTTNDFEALLNAVNEAGTMMRSKAETEQQVFRVGEGLDALEQAFAELKPSDRKTLIRQAIAHARSNTPGRKLTGKTLSLEEIAIRFPKGR
jgi:hypothetical protein